MKHWLRKAAIRITANQPAQALMEKTVRRLQFLMGIGAGSYVDSSGEQILSQRLEELGDPERPLTVFDVGANKGQFARMMIQGLHRDFRLHCFEPGQKTFEELSGNFQHDSRLVLNRFALGSEPGRVLLHYDEPGSGLASVYPRSLEHLPRLRFEQSEEVEVRTLDEYCQGKNVERIDLLKIDTEGHELEVLKGAEKAFAEGRVGMVSFEFGGCNIDSRTYLKDFMRFFSRFGEYRLYRITPSGFVVPVTHYREDREQFGVTNYLVEYG